MKFILINIPNKNVLFFFITLCLEGRLDFRPSLKVQLLVKQNVNELLTYLSHSVDK